MKCTKDTVIAVGSSQYRGETVVNKGEVSQIFDMHTPCTVSYPLNAPEIRAQEFKKFQLFVWFLSPFSSKWQQTEVLFQ